MSLKAYVLAYQLKMVLNAKTKLFKNESYDTENNCSLLKYYYFFD